MPAKPPSTRSLLTAWPQLAIAIALVGLAFAEGGFYPSAFASIAIAVWIAIGAVALQPSLLGGWLTAPALWVALLGAGFLAWTGLSLAWASDRGAGYEDVIRGLAYLGIFLLLALSGRMDRRRWLEGLLAGGGAVVVIALASRLLGFGDDGLAGELPASAGRLSFPLGYWNALGLLAAVAATLSVWAAGSARRRPGAVAAGLLPACALVVVLTDSRAAIVAAAVGAGIAVSLCERRRWAASALLTAAIATAPALLAVVAIDGIREGTLGAFAPGGLVVALLALGASLLTARAYLALAPRIGKPTFRPSLVQAAAVAGLLVGLMILVGPGVLAGDLGAGDPDPTLAPGESALISSSGRSAFWSAALDAFAEEPVRGLGAGGYENWWNAEGTLPVSIENAHSAPMETMAELGAPGLALLVAIGLVVVGTAARRLRVDEGAERELTGVALAVLAVVAIGASLDWIYEVPAVFTTGVVAAAVICSGGIPRRADAGAVHWGPAWRLALVPTAAASAVAAATLAVGSNQLERAEDALERGEVVEAARSARSASRFIPWSSAPELAVAEVESLAGNLGTAALSAEEATRKNPDDYRGWLLLATVRLQAGDRDAAEAYFVRAVKLATQVLPRAVVELRSRPAP